MDENIIQALQKCPLFEGFTADEINTAMSGVQYWTVQYAKKELYALAGTPCRYADIIVCGEMSARMAGASGKFVQMATPSAGPLLAPAFIFSKDNRIPVNIETKKATTILRMTPSTLQQLMKDDYRIQMNFIRIISTVGSFLANKVKMLTLYSVREKVATFLLEQARRSGSDIFTLAKSRQEIADSFAIQKYSLQRCLKEFAANGAIKLNGKSIAILNKQKIVSFANL